jgi:hypothetical protein
MAAIKSGVTPVPNDLFVDPKGAAQVQIIQRGNPYSVAGVTGIIAAALAAGSSVFQMRLDPGSTVNAFIERIRLQYVCMVAFTTPLTAGRRLEGYRGGGNITALSGGAPIVAAARKRSSQSPSQFDAAENGDIRIATTATLVNTGAAFDAVPFFTMPLVHVGNAGNYTESVFEFNANESAPIQIEPGQIFAIRNPVIMDPAGTWQLGVRIDWHEGLAI